MNDYAFGSILSFAGIFLLMGFDMTLGNRSGLGFNLAFMIPIVVLFIFGSYNGIRYLMIKEKVEN